MGPFPVLGSVTCKDLLAVSDDARGIEMHLTAAISSELGVVFELRILGIVAVDCRYR